MQKRNSRTAVPGQLRPVFEQAVGAMQRGQLAQAEALFSALLQRAPDAAPARHLLGVIHAETGRLQSAITLLEAASKADPRSGAILVSLGDALGRSQQFEAAAEALRKAIRVNPDFAPAYGLLGVVLARLGNNRQAAAAFEEAVRIDPSDTQSLLNRAGVAQALGERDVCSKALGMAVRGCKAPTAAFWLEAGKCYYWLKSLPEAEHALIEAITADEPSKEAVRQLSVVLAAQHRLPEAMAAAECAIRQADQPATVIVETAAALRDAGLVADAVAMRQRALDLAPTDFAIHSQGLLALNYLPDLTAAALFDAHAALAGCVSEPEVRLFENECAQQRPLRIGYVSADFRTHSVAYFIAPVLRAHDRKRCQLFGYYNNTREDQRTADFRNMFTKWRQIAHWSDDAVLEAVRQDRVDVLVDLSGHTRGNRLAMFARRAAPVQVSWLGYPNTTGIPAMHYRITDERCDPCGLTEHLHTEELIRLPDVFSCFEPRLDAPDCGPPPCLTTGFVTFGSFNEYGKLNAEVFALWARILNAVPHSRLMLKTKALKWAAVRERVHGVFKDAGIDPERIILLQPDKDVVTHLGRYASVDIALDTFPYCGTTTSCEALWQGVPVISLAGEAHRARVGLSQLSAIGLPDLVADTPDQYVASAAMLAGDPARLAELRQSMRDRMRQSPLMDYVGFTRKLEAAYQEIWERYCAGAADPN